MTAPAIPPCPIAPLAPLPRLTDGLAGVGGRLKAEPEDFRVEEIAAYEPCGEGEHRYLLIEKRGLTTDAVRRHIARTFGIGQREVGYAGRKDRVAVTTQWFSLPARAVDSVGAVERDDIRVLESALHRNKLRVGHVRGNRFVLRLRDAHPEAALRAEAKMATIAARGLPNYYGAQRMGRDGATLAAGWALAHGGRGRCEVDGPGGVTHRLDLRDRSLRKLAASALQSELFNRVLARRLREGTLHRVLEGELCFKRDSGAVFLSDDTSREQARLDRAEISPTGPMWGPKMQRPGDALAGFEREERDALGLSEAALASLGALAAGTRRPLLVWPEALSASADGDDVVVTFELPSGSYATVLVHELSGPHGDDVVGQPLHPCGRPAEGASSPPPTAPPPRA